VKRVSIAANCHVKPAKTVIAAKPVANQSIVLQETIRRGVAMEQQNAQKQCLNEPKVKEFIMETLIELNLVPKLQKKKELSCV
jgi:hypothetical protein